MNYERIKHILTSGNIAKKFNRKVYKKILEKPVGILFYRLPVKKNRIVFETLYKSKETNDYNGKRIGNLLNACGLPVGESKDTIKEVCDFCKGAYLLVGIGTRNNEYLGKNENYVKFYGKTKNGSKASTLQTEPKQEEEISDDMLPF